MNGLWNMLNGKKTMIGIIAKALTNLIAQLKPEHAATMKTLEGYVDMWLIGSVAHKIDKAGK